MKDKILEWCEFEEAKGFADTYIYPDGSCGSPILDMNFFIKYVVPKLNGWGIRRFHTSMKDFRIDVWLLKHLDGNPVFFKGSAENPVEAWQEALMKLIEG